MIRWAARCNSSEEVVFPRPQIRETIVEKATQRMRIRLLERTIVMAGVKPKVLPFVEQMYKSIAIPDIKRRTGQRTRMRLVEETIQEQQQIVAPVLTPVQIQRLTLKPPTHIKLKSLKKKPGRRGVESTSLLWDEERTYGVADPEDLLGLRRRRKK